MSALPSSIYWNGKDQKCKSMFPWNCKFDCKNLKQLLWERTILECRDSRSFERSGHYATYYAAQFETSGITSKFTEKNFEVSSLEKKVKSLRKIWCLGSTTIEMYLRQSLTTLLSNIVWPLLTFAHPLLLCLYSFRKPINGQHAYDSILSWILSWQSSKCRL